MNSFLAMVNRSLGSMLDLLVSLLRMDWMCLDCNLWIGLIHHRLGLHRRCCEA